MTTTSITLLERLRRPDDQQAWARFVEIYAPLLFHWARRAGLNEPDAADLVQDVLLLLLEKLPDFAYDPQKTFRGWLRTVTLNKWREKQRRREVTQAAGAPLDQLPAQEESEKFWDVEYRQYLLGRVMETMQATFQPTSWKACCQMVVAGRPAQDVASELGISVAAVYMAKSRVLKRLREELTGLWE